MLVFMDKVLNKRKKDVYPTKITVKDDNKEYYIPMELVEQAYNFINTSLFANKYNLTPFVFEQEEGKLAAQLNFSLKDESVEFVGTTYKELSNLLPEEFIALFNNIVTNCMILPENVKYLPEQSSVALPTLTRDISLTFSIEPTNKEAFGKKLEEEKDE